MTPTVTISRELAEKLKITSEFALSFAVPSLAANIESDLAELRAALDAPPSFDAALDDVQAGRTVSMETALSDAPASSGWRPIESAPTDQTTVLLFRDGCIFTGYFGGANSGWRYNVRQFDSIWPLPAAWQPLPPPPGDDVSTTEPTQ